MESLGQCWWRSYTLHNAENSSLQLQTESVYKHKLLRVARPYLDWLRKGSSSSEEDVHKAEH